MYAIKFDTLKLAQGLRDQAKFPPEQAEKAAALFTDTIIVGFTEWQDAQQLASKADLTATENRLAASIEQLTVKTKAEIRESELRLETRIADSKTSIVIWVVGAVAALVGAQSAFLSLGKFHG